MDKFVRNLVHLKVRHIAGILLFSNALGLYYLVKERQSYDLDSLQFSYTRYLSSKASYIASLTIPSLLRKPLFSLYGLIYEVDFDDMLDPHLENYENFQSFFTRQVKPRSFDQNQNKLIAPADSRVLSFTQITGNDTLLVKQINYKLGAFLTGQEDFQFNDETLKTLKKRENTNLYSVIFYLAPGDYHRYHCPADFSIQSRNHVIGHLAPVKVSYISTTPYIYETNERVALFGKYPFGFLSYVLVGAFNVGSMTLNYDKDFVTNSKQFDNIYKYQFYDKQNIEIKKGEEIGMFKLGSTVVMIFEARDVKWLVTEGQKCRWGDIFAEVS